GEDDRVDDPQVVAGRRIGFRQRLDAFAQIIQRLQQTSLLDLSRSLDRLVDRLAGDEAPREARRAAHAVTGRNFLKSAASREEVKKRFGGVIEHAKARSAAPSVRTARCDEQMFD